MHDFDLPIFSFQNKYYNILLPEVFQNLQDLDEKRTKCFQNFILKSCMVEKEVLPIISQCLDGMEKCAEEIDASEVSFDLFQFKPRVFQCNTN